MRAAALLLLFAAVAPAPVFSPPPAEFVQAVEFPYYLYPRANWERELVWLKTIGIGTVEFSIPWNWHQLQPGEFDFTGRTSPRRDLAGFIRILRKLQLRGWVRPLPPVAGWSNNGWPAPAPDGRAQRAWEKQLEDLLATQTQAHGGPVAFVEGKALRIDAGPPPAPVTAISAIDAAAFMHSREAIATARGALLWTDVEDRIYPEGWEPSASALLRKGAVDLSGEERPATGALRRSAALLRNWAALLPELRSGPAPHPVLGNFPQGLTATQLISPAASAMSVINRGPMAFHGDLRVYDPALKRRILIPSISVGPQQSLWLPLDVSLGPGGLCRECSNFGSTEHIVYATAELVAVEFENGILAMEFAAPEAGEAVLQLAREPVGPFLAAGKPTKFDWDDKNLRVRLPIPASKAAGNRVRIGLAVEAPETSAFFTDARRLVIGEKNRLSTVYSSPDVASRSRLRLPEGFTATASEKSPNEIDYTVSVPADALHGDWANLALEADGMLLGRTRLQMFRPVSIRLAQAMQMHFGPQVRLAAEPPTAPIETRAGANLDLVFRNNSLAIQTYHVEAAGDGLDLLPARSDLVVGAVDERTLSLRVFGEEGATGPRDLHLRVSGAVTLELPIRVLLLPRNGAIAWTADLDGDGSPEWILESQKVRAVFSSRDGGRWMEFTWKDTDTNFLPEAGAFWQASPPQIRANGNSLEFTGTGWTRTVRLSDAALTIEQTTPLPPDGITNQVNANLRLSVERPTPSRAIYAIEQSK